MKDMQVHLDKLRDDAAECAVRMAETDDKERRDRLATASQHLNVLADEVERAINRDK
jgi:hypothetical protein